MFKSHLYKPSRTADSRLHGLFVVNSQIRVTIIRGSIQLPW